MTRPPGHPPVVLSIAGSDPSGGAGIQADLKTFSALGGYGCAVITALTAQSTRGVSGVFPIPAGFVAEQLDALFADVGIDAVKVGMIANAEIARAVADALRRYAPPVVVLDPVMVATSGDRLLAPDAEDVMRSELLPLADLITPNLDEAAALLGTQRAADADETRAQSLALRAIGARRVLLKGGHLVGPEATDYLVDSDGRVQELTAERIDTANTHGTGCTLSSAVAVLRPGADDWFTAVQEAKAYLTTALRHADELMIGGTGTDYSPYSGHGPVHHFSAMWPRR
ncbi:bifunctional hydroxymethylpyrimidine kinase/phosphomethylpyrimidine kinase [Nakamurella panacisegetis]|uniref:bifunctional hydroxymethylpyrimidine kinase/phosphomethylpyrimidine kinase n=1 Tax=Nakamurella panacisegetis TaxID=1090615 RepID=UPI000A4F203C|nr:bifunctional hydroxymethylpyrimidine kinase/phosphomethylpyrimidine kinase [Nakamurella panacisegetis]